jgi:type I restriction enzyme S subunit
MAICKKKIQDSSTQSMKGMLSKTNFEMIRLIHPPSVLQKKFGKIAYNYEIILNEQRQLGIHSQSLFDSLMQKAFKGELEV